MSKHRTQRTWWDRLLAGVLCLALALGLLPAAGLVQTAEAAHWATPFAEQLVEWGVMTPSLASDLSSTITRAEFVAMCNRAFGYKRLGSMPFVDVPSSAWYAEDINIAYNAGYFSGTSATTATPNGTLTREQAVVAVANNLMLQKTVGESMGFTDSHELHEWSRGMIGAAVAEGVVSGLPDGSFRPLANITRGEIAALLVGLIGTPLSKPGSYELGDVYGNVVISSSNVTLRDTVILGNLYVTGGVDLGNVLLENVTVLGRIVVGGGGESDAAQSSVILRNVTADELVIDSLVDQFVTVSAYGLTDIPNTYVRHSAFLEDDCDAGYGLHCIELDGEDGTLFQLAGDIKKVVNKTPFSRLQLVKGTAETITVDEEAKGSTVLVEINTRVDELNLDVATYVYGRGDIIQLNIAANGCVVENILPEHVWIRPGLTATLVDDEGNEKVIGSTDADELSSEPRLLGGYPKADSLRPTQAEGLYAVNKPGTVYWAVSAVADGSVSETDLIKNPVYGGNILKDEATGLYQSGGIDAFTGTEFGRLISGLTPGGSYYISAVLVDERNNHSPLKVVSFSTPDDTRPAFMEGYPRMSKVSCEIAQVTAMVNKTCQMYWVLLPHGAAAPTVQNFKTSSFGGHYGYGSINVVKNVLATIKVNASRLQEKTGYDLYLWLNDLDGTQCSDVVKVIDEKTGNESDPSFTTPDQTPPVVTSIMQTNYNLPAAIEFSFEINEDASTLYWFVVPATDNTVIKPTDDLTSQRVQMKVKNPTGASVVVSGSMAAIGAYVETAVGAAAFEGKLKYDDWQTHEFKLYYMAVDGEGNCSVVDFIYIYTLDNEEPVVTLKFDPAKYSSEEDKKAERNPQPLTSSDIILIFSEQVKGDEDDAKTFAELYSEVERYKDLTETDADIKSSNPSNPLTKAKNALGKALEDHITLYYRQNSKDDPGTALEKPTLDSVTGEKKGEDYGWIDWREAIVKQQPNGTVELTLTAGKAVQLGGGMNYRFYFDNIYDNAHSPNPLKLIRNDGTVDGGRDASGRIRPNCHTDTFTTVFAQVWLQFMGDDTVEKAVVGKKDDGTDETQTVRMDILVDVIPDSMSSTANDAYWDMIMWCDTVVEFEIYRKDGSTWERVSDKYLYIPTTLNGTSWNARMGIADDPLKVQDSLKEGKTYSYGIHITAVNGAEEKDRKTPLASWGERVNMWFSLIVGSSKSKVGGVSKNVSASFDADRNLITGDVSEISTDYDREAESKLLGWCQFTDTQPPEFYSTYPMFTPRSSSVTMAVQMAGNRTGKLYYLAAPVVNGEPSVATATGDGKAINSVNDRNRDVSTGADGKETNIGGDKTYIPTNGGDRNDNEHSIYYKTGSKKSESAPTTAQVTAPAAFFPNAASRGFVWEGPIEVDGGWQEIPITGLQPETKYYVYIVLQGNGDDSVSEAVEIYQVTTSAAVPPVIALSRSSVTDTGVTMLVNDPSVTSSTVRYENPDLSYALTRKDDLPGFFNLYYSWNATLKAGNAGPGDGTEEKDLSDTQKKDSSCMTILDALIKTAGQGGETYFDMYASAQLRKDVLGFITQANEYQQYGATTKYYGPFNQNEERDKEFKDALSREGEYVVLACACHHEVNASIAANYGFAAIKGLYKPDDVPPEFLSPKGTNGVVDASGLITGCFDRNSVWHSDWGLGTDQRYWSFSGTITLTFSKKIYTYDNNVLKQIVAKPSTDKDIADDEISILDVIDAPANVLINVSGNATDTSFTLTFSRIRNGQSFIMHDLYNSGGSVKNDKTLTITFDTSKTEDQLYEVENPDDGPVSELFKRVVPCFFVTWRVE